jgi:hypothetical protein
MTLSTYSAVIRIDNPSGSSNTFRTQVQAESQIAAQALLEAQYGRGRVIFLQRINSN